MNAHTDARRRRRFNVDECVFSTTPCLVSHGRGGDQDREEETEWRDTSHFCFSSVWNRASEANDGDDVSDGGGDEQGVGPDDGVHTRVPRPHTRREESNSPLLNNCVLPRQF